MRINLLRNALGCTLDGVCSFKIDQVFRVALLCMGVAWPPYTRASQGGVLDIHLFPLPDHRSYVTMTTGTINGWYSLVIA